MAYQVHNFADGEIIYAGPVNEMDAQIKYNADHKIENSEKGSANGIASLDGNGKVPKSQLSIAVTDDNNGNVTLII